MPKSKEKDINTYNVCQLTVKRIEFMKIFKTDFSLIYVFCTNLEDTIVFNFDL